VKNKKLIFSKANPNDTIDIYEILFRSFKPYQKYYTDQAYKATILSPEKIKDRLLKEKYEVFITLLNSQIVGTVSISIKNQNILYIRSMAVHPDFQREGIGGFIMDNIFDITEKKGIKKIILETSKPLKNAFNFYEKHGFKKTGVFRDFYGVTIFEMIREYE
jgi:ribosomal protein S18 acetylase RimI-like enzyme